jgi:hypothetical protein
MRVRGNSRKHPNYGWATITSSQIVPTAITQTPQNTVAITRSIGKRSAFESVQVVIGPRLTTTVRVASFGTNERKGSVGTESGR